MSHDRKTDEKKATAKDSMNDFLKMLLQPGTNYQKMIDDKVNHYLETLEKNPNKYKQDIDMLKNDIREGCFKITSNAPVDAKPDEIVVALIKYLKKVDDSYNKKVTNDPGKTFDQSGKIKQIIQSSAKALSQEHIKLNTVKPESSKETKQQEVAKSENKSTQQTKEAEKAPSNPGSATPIQLEIPSPETKSRRRPL